MCGYPFAPIQMLTGDTRKGCSSRHSRLHDERRSFPQKLCIERRFESSPGVQRVATLGVFLRYFLHAAKSTNPFPFREASRFCKPRISPPKQQLPTNKIKSFSKGSSEVFQTSNQRTQTKLRAMPIKSFCRSAAFPPPLAASFRRLSRL